MKKNISKILIVLSAVLFLTTACNDDFLERVPENAITDGVLWQTPAHLELFVNSFYNRSDLLPREEGSGSAGLYSMDAIHGSDTQIRNIFNTRMNGQGSIPTTGGGWAIGDWFPLRLINHFFANYHTVTGDQALINQFVGEALFFRAIFYFNRVRSFGDVPWYDGPLGPDDEILHKPRDRREVVIDNVLADLDRAIGYLPSRSGGWTGRVNKETAMMLAARIALFEGTWQKYHAGTPFAPDGAQHHRRFLEKAVQVTDDLIALGTAGLDNVGEPNGYFNVFNHECYRNSQEVVFWREYNLTQGIGNWWNNYTPFGHLSGFTRRMVDMYLMNDGTPIYDHPLYQGTATLLDVVANRDPRMIQTLAVPGGQVQFYPDILFQYPSFENNDRGGTTGYQVIKHNIPSTVLSGAGHQQALIYFRFAEALLINAEARAELDIITQADLDRTINQLRRRLVGMADMNLAAVNALPVSTRQFPALSNIINEIRRERAVELAAEGFRRDDIFRWAAADILIRGYVPRGARLAQWQIPEGGPELVPAPPAGWRGAVEGLIADEDGYILPFARQVAFPATGFNFNLERDYLLPLPSQELLLFPNLTQNPGWE